MIDFVADDRPDLHVSQTPLTDLALALGYDGLTAVVLVARVRATARLFAHPGWAAFSVYRKALSLDQTAVFHLTVLRFIASEPLDVNLSFDPRRLFAVLLEHLPAHGSA